MISFQLKTVRRTKLRKNYPTFLVQNPYFCRVSQALSLVRQNRNAGGMAASGAFGNPGPAKKCAANAKI
jgi:hypothetical protein